MVPLFLQEIFMGLTRNNQPRAVTVEKIRSLIRELLSQEQTALPSERDLSAQTGGSRRVIREILEEMEKKDLIRMTANGRVINPRANKIPVLFVARGRNLIDNQVWARLWQAFLKQTKNMPLSPELQLIRYWPEEIEEDWQEFARKQAQYIICCTDKNLELPLEQWDAEKKTVIFTDEAYLHYGKPVISLDNVKVGEMAAEELFRHGFRSPALLTPDFSDHSYSPYRKRLEGFSRKCAELGMDFQVERDGFQIYYQKSRLQNYIAKTAEIAAEKRYDSLFLTTDDQLYLVQEVLHDHQRDVPGRFGLITLNAQNHAESGGVRVNSISHATNEMAAMLADRIFAHADGLIPQISSCSITPTIHEGETLCIRGSRTFSSEEKGSR